MQRRQALAVLGTAVTAGCSGIAPSLGGRDRPPASFGVRVDAPSEVQLGEAFDVGVSVTNTGGQAGTYRGAVRAFVGMVDDVDVPVAVGPVPPGETRETTVGPVVAAYAGRWAVELDEVSRDIDVFPVAVDAGQSVVVTDDIRLTVEDVTVRSSYEYQTAAGETGTRSADDGFAFIFGTVRVENLRSTGRNSPSRSEFAGASADGLFPVYFGPDSWDDMRIDGAPYPGKRKIPPGESLAGWVALTIPDTAAETAVVWNRDRVTSPPEAVWRVSAGAEQ